MRTSRTGQGVACAESYLHSSSSSTRIPVRTLEPLLLKNDAYDAYKVKFERSWYGYKDNEKIFPMLPVTSPCSFWIIRNCQNKSESRVYFWGCVPVLAHWAVYRIRVQLGCISRVLHDPSPLNTSCRLGIARVLLWFRVNALSPFKSVCETVINRIQ